MCEGRCSCVPASSAQGSAPELAPEETLGCGTGGGWKEALLMEGSFCLALSVASLGEMRERLSKVAEVLSEN